MKLKHNKFKNTGILFELLTRQITADIMSNKDSAAVDVVKKYFSKGEIGKEYKIYQALTKATSLNEAKAEGIISATIKLAERLNRTALRKEKYNLIKEIKSHYDLEEFFKAKIHNYKAHAAVYNLIEAQTTLEFIDPAFVIDNKVTLLEFLTKQEVDKNKVENQVLAEYSTQDKATRALISQIMIEKFNDKYSNLIPEQREVLKVYINKISNTVSLREYVNQKLSEISNSISLLKFNVTDKRTQIKLEELTSIIKPLDKNESVKDDDILNLLQFYELIHEIKHL